MPGESSPVVVFSDGVIKSPSERWLGPFDAMCRFKIAPGIDIAEVDALFPDDVINDNWWAFVGAHPNGYGQEEIKAFANKHFTFPEREAPVHQAVPGETIVEHCKRNIQAAFRLATADTTSQIGNTYASFEPGERFSDKRPHRGRFYGWDQLPVCKAVLRTMGKWGLYSTASTLANRKQQAAKNEGRIGTVNTTWGATRNQEPVELRIQFDHIEHLHPMPDDLESLDELDRFLVGQAVERKRAEALIAKVKFFDDYYMHWRDGADGPTKLGLAPGSVYKHLVRLPNGSFAYRHYDTARGPRDEMRQADLELLQEWTTANGGVAPTEAEAMLLFDSLRISAADGQDFRAVDQRDPTKFYTLHTAELAAIKLNALQYENASKLAYIYRQKAAIALQKGDLMEELGAVERAEFFETEATNLNRNIHEYFLTDDGFCADYDFVAQRTQPANALAGVFALGAGVFSHEIGSQMLDRVEELFGRPGGLVNTLAKDSPQQWDNNAWAIMQMEAVDGAVRYKRYDLAVLWTERWLRANDLMFEKYQALYEKSDPNNPGEPGGGGEYDCVKNLLMSLAVDLVLRSKLGWLQEMARNQLNVKRGETGIPQAVGHITLRSTVEPIFVAT